VAIAGNVGTRERFEYTVIGDPVNEAARLADLAKEGHGLLASSKVVEAAERSVALDWTFREEIELRGRHEPTRVFVPSAVAPRASASDSVSNSVFDGREAAQDQTTADRA
jgi:adenylate cyclase